MELHDALQQLQRIKDGLARAEQFQGYRAQTTAFSSAIAFVAAAIQHLWQPGHLWQYLTLWFGAAFLCVIVVGAEMFTRCLRSHSTLQRQVTIEAVEQFIPCLAAGGLLTFVLVLFARSALWLLPGLWAILFSLGIFASRRMLPKGVSIVAGYYLLSGLFVIRSTSLTNNFSSWSMIITFGVGQGLATVVLWWSERHVHAASI